MKRTFFFLALACALAIARPAHADSCHAAVFIDAAHAPAVVVPHPPAAVVIDSAYALRFGPLVVDRDDASAATLHVAAPAPASEANGARSVIIRRRGLCRRLRVIVRP